MLYPNRLGYKSMVTVLRAHGWSVIIYKDDHPPAHVHIFGHGGWMKVNLAAPGDEQALVKSVGLKTQEVRRAMALVEERRELLLQRWEAIHGTV